MLEQATDFREESEALYALLLPLRDADFARRTQFRDWTIDDVLQHLHYFNVAADISLTDSEGIKALLAEVQAARAAGESLRDFADRKLEGLKGRALLEAWHGYIPAMAARFHAADPKARLTWAGPDMSARSSITARLMETWAHGQEVYDLLGAEREEKDRIRNIVVIGNNTFGWTFANRGEAVPETRPFLRLTAPSGKVWEFNEPSETERIEGLAVEFCQVVTQTRNIADTALAVAGPTAGRWMALAQCFAGPPVDPPAPGSRFRQG